MNAATRRKTAIERIRSLAPRVLEHHIKLQMYPNTNMVAGWKTELTAWESKIRRLIKGKSGSPNVSLDELVELLYEDCLEEVELADFVFEGIPSEPIHYPKVKDAITGYAKKILAEP